MEHLRHFQLSDDPFRNELRADAFLETSPHEDALHRIERGVRQARGLTVLIGEGGAGKTLLVRRLLERLEEEVFEVHMLGVLSPAADGNWLLESFATQLGVESIADQRDSLMAQIVEHLAIIREDGRHCVLVIDDAQLLAQPGVLAEVGTLLKLEYEDRRLLSIVLSGDPSLEVALANTPNLVDRVDVKARLVGLDVAGTRDYVAHRMQRACADSEIFAPDAFEALCERGRGLPGRMNTLADNALYEAYLSRADRVTGTEIERAHRDLSLGARTESALSGSEIAVEVSGGAERGIAHRAYAEPVLEPSLGPMVEGPLGLGPELEIDLGPELEIELDLESEIDPEPELEADADLDGELEVAFDSMTVNGSRALANPRLSPNEVAEISISTESSDSFLLESEMRVPHGSGADAKALGLPPRSFDDLDAGLDEFLRDENSEDRSLRDLLETS